MLERHPQIGFRMLESLGVQPVAEWVLHHHERWDGAGYPNRLSGDQIPLDVGLDIDASAEGVEVAGDGGALPDHGLAHGGVGGAREGGGQEEQDKRRHPRGPSMRHRGSLCLDRRPRQARRARYGRLRYCSWASRP